MCVSVCQVSIWQSYKQQISKFCPQILNTEASFYIYHRPLADINVIASVCALNFDICCFRAVAFATKRN